MALPGVRVSGSWRAGAGRPHLRVSGAWKICAAWWVMRWTLISEVGEPVYDKEWKRLFDYTQPGGYVQNVTMGWTGNESNGGPYSVDIGWTLSLGYPVEVRVFKWTGSWSQVASTVVPESAGGYSTSQQFYDGDQVYAEVRYVAHDDASITGPTTSTTPQMFTW